MLGDMSRPAPPVDLSPRQRAILERVSSSRTLAQRLVERAKYVLLSDDGVSGTDQAERLGVEVQRPRRWRKRWAGASADVDAAEAAGASDRELEARILETLGDAPRPGTPPKFSPEQLTRLIALACEPPADSGLPTTHWTPAELAAEAVKRGIVEEISPRHLDRILKRGRPPAS